MNLKPIWPQKAPNKSPAQNEDSSEVRLKRPQVSFLILLSLFFFFHMPYKWIPKLVAKLDLSAVRSVRCWQIVPYSQVAYSEF